MNTFNLQSAIDAQQTLVIILQAKAYDGVEGATAELANAIAGLRNLQAMERDRPKAYLPTPSLSDPTQGYLIR